MSNTNGHKKVLVVSSDSDLVEQVGRTLGPYYAIDFALNEQEGLSKARKERPDAVILGHLEPRGTSFAFHNRMHDGWLTRQIPLLVVDFGANGDSSKGWTREEGLLMEADDYIPASEIEVSRALRDRVNILLASKINRFAEALLDPLDFCVTWEQIPGRGAFERQQEEVMENITKAALSEEIHAVSVTDNPGGNPAISTEMLCTEAKRSGVEPLVHLACRDKNRNQIESILYGLAAGGVRNLLVLTGDAPSSDGFLGRPKPVFDFDPIHVLQLITAMNQGLERPNSPKLGPLAPTDFFAGCCVSPFKKLEGELMGQYFKLRKKIKGGARFVITQVGYDARKFHEVLQWLKMEGYEIPVLANIYVLSYGAANMMNKNQIPGCVVTDKLLAELAKEKEASDKGKSARILRAAKMYALAKGMGYAGAHLGGHGIGYDVVEEIIERGEELAKDWQSLVAEFDYPMTDGFYMFKKDPVTGLNSSELAERPLKPRKRASYSQCRLAHKLFFNEKSRRFNALRPWAKRIDSWETSKDTFEYTEHLAKVATFGCMNCGDCSLFDIAYLCPMSQCPKNQRNGPCGGSYDGWCEVYPGTRKCIWERAYERMKAYGEEDELGERIVPPCNWELQGTSSWLNFYLGRDHTAKRLGIEPVGKTSSEGKASVPGTSTAGTK